MKTCEQVASDVLARRDAYLKTRKEKLQKTKKYAAVFFVLLAAVTAAAGLIRVRLPSGTNTPGKTVSNASSTAPTTSGTAAAPPTESPSSVTVTDTSESETTAHRTSGTERNDPTEEEHTTAPYTEEKTTVATAETTAADPTSTEGSAETTGTQPVSSDTEVSVINVSPTVSHSETQAAVIPEAPSMICIVWSGRLFAAQTPRPRPVPADAVYQETDVYVFGGELILGKVLYDRFGNALPDALQIRADPEILSETPERSVLTLCVDVDGTVYAVTPAGAFPLEDMGDAQS